MLSLTVFGAKAASEVQGENKAMKHNSSINSEAIPESKSSETRTSETRISEAKIPKEIFRAYDIRGIVDTSLTPEIVYDIGRALGSMVLAAGEKKIIVGRDGRLSGPLLITALTTGLLASGCDVVDIGQVPTPVLYFATHYLKISSGIALTGSHNPSNHNGLKIMIAGKPLYGEGIQEIYRRLCSGSFQTGSGYRTTQDILDDYEKSVSKDINLKRRLKVVVDCGNGVASVIAPKLYQSLGCEIIPLFCEVDGNFPNHHPDPGQPKNLQDLIAAVRNHKADLGLAFDGDGDRLGVVDDTGKIIWPDRLLILFAKEVLKQFPETEILYDVKCTRHVEKEITKMKGRAEMWKTGHSLIKARMHETGAKLAGEMSGHLFFKDRWYGFDDALYAGARMLEILANQPEKASTLFDAIPDSVNTPEIYLPVSEEEKVLITNKLVQAANAEKSKFAKASMSTIDGLRIDFEDGFGLVRPSNTAANLILRFEGEDSNALQRIQGEFKRLLGLVAPELKLTF